MTGKESHDAKLRRALTLPMLTLYGLGVTVGAGIYVLVGATAAEAGIFAPVSFVIAAAVVSFTAFSYAELGSRYPVSAGEAAYVEAGTRQRWLALLVGLSVASSGVVSASAVAIGAASYLHGLTGLTVPVLTIALVLTMGAIAWWGISQSVGLAAVITVVEISGLLFVIGWAAMSQNGSPVQISDMVPPLQGAHWVGIGAASLLAFFAFVGFEDMANVAEEVKDPVHAIPRAIVLTLIVATLLYVATTTAVIVTVPMEDLSGSTAPLVLVFRDAPQFLRDAFAAIAVVATVNGVLIQMIMASRVVYGLADRGQLPAVLARVSPRTRTPWAATLLVTLTIAVLSQTVPIEHLAERTSQIVLVVFVVVNASLIRLKFRAAPETPYFRVPLIVPIFGVLTSVALFATAAL